MKRNFFYMLNPDTARRFRVDAIEGEGGELWFVQDASQSEYGSRERKGYEVTSTNNPDARIARDRDEALAIVATEMVNGVPPRKPIAPIVWHGWDGTK